MDVRWVFVVERGPLRVGGKFAFDRLKPSNGSANRLGPEHNFLDVDVGEAPVGDSGDVFVLQASIKSCCAGTS